MFLNILLLVCGSLITLVSGYISIIGLTSIFSNKESFYVIIAISSILEIAKICITLWLHHYWNNIKIWLKIYMSSILIILICLNMVSSFGFLSKSHSETNLTETIAVDSQKQEIKLKIDQIVVKIEDNQKQIDQIDDAINKLQSSGKVKTSLSVFSQYNKKREQLINVKNTLENEKLNYQKEYNNIDKANKIIEVELQPIRYLAELIFDKTDHNLIEKTIKLVTLLIVFVFDPLAIMLIIAASHGFHTRKDITHNISFLDLSNQHQPLKEEIMSNKALVDRILENTKIDLTARLDQSKIFDKKDMVPTPIPMLNVALSGQIDGGLVPGILTIAGQSKNFKSNFSLLIAAAFLRKHEDSILIFYDSEFGANVNYFKSFGIDPERVVHIPITDVEKLKIDIVSQLNHLTENDKVIMIIDSIGNLASIKELEDAKNEKSVADMTRAKSLKGLFRMVTPLLNLKNIPMIVVNHVYSEIGTMYPKEIVSGGRGSIYSSNMIWLISRVQQKEDGEVSGYKFNINVEKSRYVKEASKIPITVSFEGGVSQWAGLLDVAIEGGYIDNSSKGWYQKIDKKTGEVLSNKMRAADIENNSEFWTEMFLKTDFASYIKEKYSLPVNTYKTMVEVDYSNLNEMNYE